MTHRASPSSWKYISPPQRDTSVTPTTQLDHRLISLVLNLNYAVMYVYVYISLQPSSPECSEETHTRLYWSPINIYQWTSGGITSTQHIAQAWWQMPSTSSIIRKHDIEWQSSVNTEKKSSTFETPLAQVCLLLSPLVRLQCYFRVCIQLPWLFPKTSLESTPVLSDI